MASENGENFTKLPDLLLFRFKQLYYRESKCVLLCVFTRFR
jgi:hypothetical protein